MKSQSCGRRGYSRRKKYDTNEMNFATLPRIARVDLTLGRKRPRRQVAIWTMKITGARGCRDACLSRGYPRVEGYYGVENLSELPNMLWENVKKK